MADVWKDKLNKKSIREFAIVVQTVHTPFNADGFINSVMDETWEKP